MSRVRSFSLSQPYHTIPPPLPVFPYLDLPQEIQDKILKDFYTFNLIISSSSSCFSSYNHCIQEGETHICGFPSTSLKLTCRKIRQDIRTLKLHLTGFTGTLIVENELECHRKAKLTFQTCDPILQAKFSLQRLLDRVTTIHVGSVDSRETLTWGTADLVVRLFYGEDKVKLPRLRFIEFNWHSVYSNYYELVNSLRTEEIQDQCKIDTLCAYDVTESLRLRRLVERLRYIGQPEVTVLLRLRWIADGSDVGFLRVSVVHFNNFVMKDPHMADMREGSAFRRL